MYRLSLALLWLLETPPTLHRATLEYLPTYIPNLPKVRNEKEVTWLQGSSSVYRRSVYLHRDSAHRNDRQSFLLSHFPPPGKHRAALLWRSSDRWLCPISCHTLLSFAFVCQLARPHWRVYLGPRTEPPSSSTHCPGSSLRQRRFT
ncbi:hypothetical protein GGR51DRAFT_126608 [Nemania sp. FL0031]|nr:hypothetical protein GGR51DRAFT_126608 [Nemania sp. FL0031]